MPQTHQENAPADRVFAIGEVTNLKICYQLAHQETSMVTNPYPGLGRRDRRPQP